MSESVQLALINNLPMILTAAAALFSAWRAQGAKKTAAETKDEVNGAIQKFIHFMEAANRAETKGARAEALAEAALQTATATPPTSVVVPLAPHPARSTDRKPGD